MGQALSLAASASTPLPAYHRTIVMDPIRRARTVALLAATALCGIGWILSAPLSRADEERLWRYRNLGKAFYENPTTQRQAVEEFRKARDLAPASAREILNYGLDRKSVV